MKSKRGQTAAIDLSKASEGGLLEYAMAIYRLTHDDDKAKFVFAKLIGRSEPHLDQCLTNTAHLGTVNWLKIQRVLPMKVFDIWTSQQQKQFDFAEPKKEERS